MNWTRSSTYVYPFDKVTFPMSGIYGAVVGISVGGTAGWLRMSGPPPIVMASTTGMSIGAVGLAYFPMRKALRDQVGFSPIMASSVAASIPSTFLLLLYRAPPTMIAKGMLAMAVGGGVVEAGVDSFYDWRRDKVRRRLRQQQGGSDVAKEGADTASIEEEEADGKQSIWKRMREGSPAMEVREESKADKQAKIARVMEEERAADEERKKLSDDSNGGGGHDGEQVLGRKSGGWWRWLPIKRVTRQEVEERIEIELRQIEAEKRSAEATQQKND